MSCFVLHLCQQNGFAFEARGSRDPIAFGEHSNNFAVRVLADLSDQRLPIGIGHPVLRFDFLIGGDVRFKACVEIHSLSHCEQYWCKDNNRGSQWF